MKIKNILAFLLIACMICTLFAACGEKPIKDDDTKVSEKAPVSANVSEEPDEEEEIVEINFMGQMMGTSNDDADKIWEKINEIAEREIGVHVNYSSLPMADYGPQLTLAIGNKEQVDICGLAPMPAFSFMTLYSMGALMDITDLLNEYGQDIKAALGEEVLNSTSVDGRVYSLTAHRNAIADGYIMYRTDVLQEAGATEQFKSMTTWADFEQVLGAVTALGAGYAFGNNANPSYNFVAAGPNIKDSYGYDYLSDTLYMVWTDQKGNVELLYDRPEVVDYYKRLANWYAKGYYFPDSSVTADSAEVSMSRRVFSGSFTGAIYGVENAKKQAVGTEVSVYMMSEGMMATSGGRGFGMAIPSTSKEPAAAMKFLNLLYSSSEVMNLLIWGIEGENYVINSAGEAAYPEGKDGTTCGYHSVDFAFGNNFLLTPWEGSGADFYKLSEQDYMNGQKSIYLGLAVDTSGIASTISALNSVKGEYFSQIANGQYTDKMYEEFLNKLDSAGVDEYIGLYRTAVSDWMA